MYPHLEDRDTPEIRILRTLYDLNARLLGSQSVEERTVVRSAIVTLRTELLKLIEAMPVMSEEDVRLAQTKTRVELMPLQPIARGSH